MEGEKDMSSMEIKFYPEPIRGTCIACKEKTAKMLLILHRNSNEMDIEWIATLAMAQKILQQCLELCPNDNKVPAFLSSSFPLLKRILMILEGYYEQVVKLLRAGKITRILSSTKLKKTLSTQNLHLHIEIKKLEKKLLKSEIQKLLQPAASTPRGRKRFLLTLVQPALDIWNSANPRNQV
jgi:hypothetical protein